MTKAELIQIVKSGLAREFGSIQAAADQLLIEAQEGEGWAQRTYGGVKVFRQYNRPKVWSSFSVRVRGIGTSHAFSIAEK